MASKYAHVVKDLPKYIGDDPTRTILLNNLRDEIRTTPINDEKDYNISVQILRKAVTLEDAVTDMLQTAKKCPNSNTSSGLARAYADARTVLDIVNGWKSSAQLLVDAYERMMTDQMEAEEVTGVRLASGALISTFSEPYGQVVDKEKFRLWCIASPDKCMECGGTEADHHPSTDEPHTCQETKVGNYQSLDLALHTCGQPAYTLVQPRGRSEGPYWLCHADAAHYLHNRDCEDVTPEGTPKAPHRFHPGGGYENQLQLWPSTMNALAKERTLAGEPPPDGVEVTAKIQVRLNKA